jgi:hypothetical protein
MAKRALSRAGWRTLGLICLALLAVAATTATVRVLAAEEPTLRERLEKGLRARTSADFAYLDRVIVEVEGGNLPQTLVDRVFFWARKKAEEQDEGKRKRPMIYFRPALTILAARIGVDLE